MSGATQYLKRLLTERDHLVDEWHGQMLWLNIDDDVLSAWNQCHPRLRQDCTIHTGLHWQGQGSMSM